MANHRKFKQMQKEFTALYIDYERAEREWQREKSRRLYLLHYRTSRSGKTNREMEKREARIRINSIVTSCTLVRTHTCYLYLAKIPTPVYSKSFSNNLLPYSALSQPQLFPYFPSTRFLADPDVQSYFFQLLHS